MTTSVIGIPNLGNTCYRSSVVQMLIHLSISSSQLFQDMVKAYRSKQMNFEDLVHNTVYENPGEQHDAHEFLIHVLDKIGDSGKFKLKGYRRMLNPETGETRKIPFTESVLSLPVSQSFHHSLNTFFQTEVIDGYRWGEDTITMHSKHVVSRWPPYLIIHFQRYTSNMSKISRNIHVPVSWKIVHDHGNATIMTCYRLQSTILHLGGSLESGHYVSIVNDSGDMYFCNDERVTRLRESAVRKILPQSYLLLFVREKKGRVSSK